MRRFNGRFFSTATLLCGGGLVLSLILTLPAAAQSLRLDDVFTTRGLELQTLTLRDFEEDPDRPGQVMEQLADLLEEAQYGAVLNASEPLAAWFDPSSPEYSDLLHIRGQAYKGLGQTSALRSVGATYLRRFGEDAPHSGWFLLELAREALEERNRRAAMGFWLRLLENDHPIPMRDGLEGARLFLQFAEPARTRAILERSFPQDTDSSATETRLLERDRLLIESLLLADDARVVVPPSREGTAREDLSFNLRRAMLLEIRSGHSAALPEYERLSHREGMLPEAERQLLRDRLRHDESRLWRPSP